VVKRSESLVSANTHEMGELRTALRVCDRGPVLKGKLNSNALYVVVGCADGCADGWHEEGCAEGSDEEGCTDG